MQLVRARALEHDVNIGRGTWFRVTRRTNLLAIRATRLSSYYSTVAIEVANCPNGVTEVTFGPRAQQLPQIRIRRTRPTVAFSDRYLLFENLLP